jgi:hypothetical protein
MFFEMQKKLYWFLCTAQKNMKRTFMIYHLFLLGGCELWSMKKVWNLRKSEKFHFTVYHKLDWQCISESSCFPWRSGWRSSGIFTDENIKFRVTEYTLFYNLCFYMFIFFLWRWDEKFLKMTQFDETGLFGERKQRMKSAMNTLPADNYSAHNQCYKLLESGIILPSNGQESVG